MSNVAIVYWSGTGNTEAMADFVAEGVEAKGGTATSSYMGRNSVSSSSSSPMAGHPKAKVSNSGTRSAPKSAAWMMVAVPPFPLRLQQRSNNAFRSAILSQALGGNRDRYRFPT